MFDNIPDELKQFNQWVVWQYEDGENGKPTKVPYNARTGRLADVTNSADWSAFHEAVNACPQWSGIGFALSSNDPFAFIDLDDPYERLADGSLKYDNPGEIYERQQMVYQSFDSYAELSPSGKGLHIIVKGAVECGRRRSAIEVYSDARYMTMTGNVYRKSEINERQQLLTTLWGEMGGVRNLSHHDGNAPQTADDDEIIQRGLNAANGDKFAALLNGNWASIYPSQSEADFAFVDMLAFYTQNRQQITRIFLQSPLGQRDKAKRNGYIDWMIGKSFDRLLPPIDFEGLRNQMEAALAKAPAEMGTLDVQPGDVVVTEAPTVSADECGPYTVPPGLVGEIAQFIYQAAPRPVPEIALAGSLALMAGICGRAFNVSGTGLNHYLLLLAKTGTGKEAIANGIGRLMAQVKKTVPAAGEYVGPGEIASPQALIKQLDRTKSFVSVIGEVGIWLKLLCDPRAPAHMVGLRKTMLDLFNKSGAGQTMQPYIYSNKENNTKAIDSPAFSLMGESTPERFYEALDDSMISEGFLPRFSLIEYKGDRPHLNIGHQHVMPSFHLVEKVAALSSHCIMLNGSNKAVDVKLTEEVERMSMEFNTQCDDRIRNSQAELTRQLWNRAHIKALKLAALIAVGVNPYDPIVTATEFLWAKRVCEADVMTLIHRFESGQVGMSSDEMKRLEDFRRVVREFYTRPFSEIKGYGVSSGMYAERVIPHGYMSKRLLKMASFKNTNQATTALKNTIQLMLDAGDMCEVSPQNRSRLGLGSGKAYMVAEPTSFGIG